MELAAEGAAEIHDRCRAGHDVFEVADGLGVGCVPGDPHQVLGVFAADLSGGEGGCEDVEVVCLAGRVSPDGAGRAPLQAADARDRGASRWLPGQRLAGRLAESCRGRFDHVARLGVVGRVPFVQLCRRELQFTAGVLHP